MIFLATKIGYILKYCSGKTNKKSESRDDSDDLLDNPTSDMPSTGPNLKKGPPFFQKGIFTVVVFSHMLTNFYWIR